MRKRFERDGLYMRTRNFKLPPAGRPYRAGDTAPVERFRVIIPSRKCDGFLCFAWYARGPRGSARPARDGSGVGALRLWRTGGSFRRKLSLSCNFAAERLSRVARCFSFPIRTYTTTIIIIIISFVVPEPLHRCSRIVFMVCQSPAATKSRK